MLPAGYPHEHVGKIREQTDHHTDAAHLVAMTSENPTEEKKKENLQKLIAQFPQIFDGVCRPMNGPASHFELKEGTTPIAIRGSQPVAVPLVPRLKSELELLEQQEIIKNRAHGVGTSHCTRTEKRWGYPSVRGLQGPEPQRNTS